LKTTWKHELLNTLGREVFRHSDRIVEDCLELEEVLSRPAPVTIQEGAEAEQDDDVDCNSYVVSKDCLTSQPRQSGLCVGAIQQLFRSNIMAQ
jgi:hypothetical protein